MKSVAAIVVTVLALSLSQANRLAVAAEEDHIPDIVEYEGTVIPAREAEITPLWPGQLMKINFVPGQFVQEGDVLFEFALRPQELNTKLAEARHASAVASLREAEAKLLRARTLETKDVVSLASMEEAEANRDIAAANVDQAKYSLEREQIALSKLTLKAPFAGMMSAPLVRENGWQDPAGTGGDSIAMAIITQLDPIQVVGEVPFVVFAARRKLLNSDEAAREGIILSIVMPNGEIYPHEGRIVSGGYKFDEETQKLKVWGEFPNPDLLLRPGLRVTVVSTVKQSILDDEEHMEN